MKSKVCFLTLFISIMSTVTAFAFCDVELLIFPPNDDGGEKIIYYRVEYMNIEQGVWHYHDCSADYPYKKQSYKLCNLTCGVQYLFRVSAINKNGPGDPGSARVTGLPLKDGVTLTGFEVQCGPGKSTSKVRSEEVLITPFYNSIILQTEIPDVKIPYRIE